MTRLVRDHKVIAVDNFNRELYSDRLIVSGLTKETAEKVAEELNDGINEDSNWLHCAVDINHTLYKFEP